MPTDDATTIVLAALTGAGLAAACGFRVFVPLLALGLAVRAEACEVNEQFAWIASTPALLCFGVATVLEVGAFYIPFVDNLLDTIATPAAAVAGAFAASAVLVGLDPWLHWSLGIVAGAGLATAIHLPTAAARGVSSATTAGVANPGLATTEVATSSLVSAMALLAPITIPIVVIGLLAGAFVLFRKRRAR